MDLSKKKKKRQKNKLINSGLDSSDLMLIDVYNVITDIQMKSTVFIMHGEKEICWVLFFF